MNLDVLTAISPIDGRYRNKTEQLAGYFSEYALIRYRVRVEIEYFITLCELPLPQLEGVDPQLFESLRDIYRNFTEQDAARVKEIEKTTNHDVKAVEYFIKESLSPKLGDDRGLNNRMTGVSSDPQPPNLGGLDFIANGDRAVLRKVRHVQELYGFRFAEATMTFPDYDDYELTAIVMLDTLTTEAPALTREQQEQLYNAVLEDYSDIPRKTDRVEKLKNDRFYNALQVKFSYAVTCHKAQGGQWAHIYLDQGYMTDDMLTTDYIHWLYTAFTRATEKLFLVNWPKTQVDSL